MIVDRVVELREQLELLKRDLHCADMIDNGTRREREMARIRAQILTVKDELAAVEHETRAQ